MRYPDIRAPNKTKATRSSEPARRSATSAGRLAGARSRNWRLDAAPAHRQSAHPGNGANNGKNQSYHQRGKRDPGGSSDVARGDARASRATAQNNSQVIAEYADNIASANKHQHKQRYQRQRPGQSSVENRRAQASNTRRARSDKTT